MSYRSFENFVSDEFCTDLLSSNILRPSDQDLDVESMLKNFSVEVSRILIMHAPIKVKTVPVRNTTPWTNSSITHARAERRKAERVWRRSRLTVHYEIYKSKQNEVFKLIDASRRNYFHDKISACNNDQKKLFTIVHGLLGSKQCSDVLPLHDCREDLANVFSNFFVDKVKKFNLNKKSTSTGNRFDDLYQFSGKQLNSFEPTAINEIILIVKKSSSAFCDLDPLPSNLLKDDKILNALMPTITEIIIKSLKPGTVPDSMKCALIKPLVKKASYRL
ncbi:hypothetical protein HOLleu_23788 [Holothuria leucospilota]|uniref:Uncharacterized protein n=1 Tax=Holothuria leucospilota TaxID=206669 RepID=A0A9Q1H5T6_HOLLE|nr:hypothetical protein HOLleu_23788 [Holothuria leucospilota]